MAKLIILCGLPGSGKSYYAAQLWRRENTFDEPTAVVHSSDAIRKELFGDAGSQENNALVFETMHKRVKDDLRAGKTVIYDATNITRKSRRGIINMTTKTILLSAILFGRLLILVLSEMPSASAT